MTDRPKSVDEASTQIPRAGPLGRWLKKHPHSAFIGNFATLFSGKAGAFVISLLTIPIIARLFNPADFGVAAFLLAVVGVVGIVATLRYDLAIVLIKDPAEAARMAWLAIYVSIFSALVFLVIALGVNVIRGVPPFYEKLGWAAWVIPVGVLLTGIMRVVEGWCVRGKHFGTLASADIAMAGGNSGLRLIGGFVLGSSVFALLASYFAAMIGKIALLARRFSLRDYAREAGNVQDMRRLALQYSDFPKYNATAEFARSLAQRLPILMLGYLFSPAIVGFFAMGMRLVQTPLGLLVTSFRRVYLQRAAEVFNEGRSLRGPLLKATLVSLLLAIVPFLVLLFFGEEILTVLLGQRWSAAGRYAEILAPFLLLTWVTTPSSATLVVIRRQKMWLGVQLAVAAAQFTAMVVANNVVGTAEATIGAHVWVGVVGNLGVIALTIGTLPAASGEKIKTDG